MHCYAVNKKVLVHCAVYIVTYTQEKIYLLTVLYALLRILKKNLLVHYAVYTVSILKKEKKRRKKRVGALCCIHCYAYPRKEEEKKYLKKCCFTVLYTLLRILTKNVLAHCAVCIVMEAEADKESSLQMLIQIGFRDGDDQYKLRPGHSVWIRPIGPATQ